MSYVFAYARDRRSRRSSPPTRTSWSWTCSRTGARRPDFHVEKSAKTSAGQSAAEQSGAAAADCSCRAVSEHVCGISHFDVEAHIRDCRSDLSHLVW